MRGVCRNSRSRNDHVVWSSWLRQGFSVTIRCTFFFLSPLTAVRKSLRRSWVERRLGGRVSSQGGEGGSSFSSGGNGGCGHPQLPGRWPGEASRMLVLGPGSSSTWEGVCPTPPCLWPLGGGIHGEYPNWGSSGCFRCPISVFLNRNCSYFCTSLHFQSVEDSLLLILSS